jgi:hypothetical protein
MKNMMRTPPLLLLLVTASALALSACGGSGDGSAGGAGSNEDKAFDGALKFAKCMRDHGIDMPDPQRGNGGGIMLGRLKSSGASGPEKGAGPKDPKFQAAQKDCGKFLQGGGGKAPSPAEQAKQRDAFVAYARCMRGKGITMPDPKVSANGIQMRLGPGANPDSPKFKAADAACHPILSAVEPKGAKPGRGPSNSTSKGPAGVAQ